MSQTALSAQKPNKDQGLIKLAAIFSMIIDHTGVVFFPGALWLRMLGRIAFPLFCWGIVIGFERSRNWRRYAFRLFLTAVFSQPFFMLALDHAWNQLNVLATLLLGLLSIAGIREKWRFSHIWAPVLCLLLGAAFQMDYGWRGVLLIILMFLARDSKGGLAALMVAFCLYWGSGGTVIPRGLVLFLTGTPFAPVNRAMSSLLNVISLQTLAILSLPMMLINTHSGLRVPRWLGYLVYPGHLFLLWALSYLLRSNTLL